MYNTKEAILGIAGACVGIDGPVRKVMLKSDELEAQITIAKNVVDGVASIRFELAIVNADDTESELNVNFFLSQQEQDEILNALF